MVNRILDSGRATVTYDRIGTGRSSRPPSTSVTLSVDVWILEQILRWLQPHRYHQIISHLHSYSAGVGIQHATTPGMTPVHHLVVTGFLHSARNPAVAGRIYPANQDQTRWHDLDDGWVTTRPHTRGRSFHGPNARRPIIRSDEHRKDVVSATAFAGYLAQHDLPREVNPAGRVTVPVTVVIGTYDAIFCHTTLNCFDQPTVETIETSYYHASSRVRVRTAPAGHSLALDPSTVSTFRTVNHEIEAVRRDPVTTPTAAGPVRRPCPSAADCPPGA